MKFNLYYADRELARLLDDHCIGSLRAPTRPVAERKAVTYPRQHPEAAVIVVPAPSLFTLRRAA